MENYKDIIGYEGLYQISNLGNVKSLERYVMNKHSFKKINEKILKPIITKNGYLSVSLTKDKKVKPTYIHQLVAIHFLNHIPNGFKYVIDHINGDKTNNTLSNLRIVSNRDNSTICYRKDKINFTSKYIGVSWKKEVTKWRAQIRINGVKKHLGYFDNELEAAECYQKALNKL